MKQLALSLAPPPAPALDNFFPGRNAELLAVLCNLVAGREAERCIYLWGEAGSGRSHLLSATLAGLRAAGLNCLHLGSGEPVPAPAAQLRAVAVDDVEMLDARNQRAFFNLYNQLRERTGIVLAAGDAPPARLKLRPELLTRLGWGLVYQVQGLTDDEKALALKQHAAARSFDLPDGVIDYLLRHLSRDLPSLMSVLDALDRHSLEAKRSITLPLLKELLRPEDGAPR
ncbi:MAG: DnaA regulatory inactivator Hda [Betaproteobacteria bacterium]|jgi:DnaA family protein